MVLDSAGPMSLFELRMRSCPVAGEASIFSSKSEMDLFMEVPARNMFYVSKAFFTPRRRGPRYTFNLADLQQTHAIKGHLLPVIFPQGLPTRRMQHPAASYIANGENLFITWLFLTMRNIPIYEPRFSHQYSIPNHDTIDEIHRTTSNFDLSCCCVPFIWFISWSPPAATWCSDSYAAPQRAGITSRASLWRLYKAGEWCSASLETTSIIRYSRAMSRSQYLGVSGVSAPFFTAPPFNWQTFHSISRGMALQLQLRSLMRFRKVNGFFFRKIQPAHNMDH